ncbi:hypothetical protein BABINDRAFT_162998 [Babjeviella inositovora NRRL Y-12698]|uniref:Uncharacterized protein n=1 Tax=Babjeviella inositovora NRRL Y-12698 TaxID=984486 RepID=A0A1E3QJT0_9ASCO|nr:uncharacterized protein BABINDRAFT_162998 [Babjeviella inositovora NRRL Y-12698]ODQ77945.1 hypothetical protein BABINDRAFT_162998 [Babjeviella inositovora NRRL Y-12698]
MADLISIANQILDDSEDLKSLEYKRKGRKYRLVENTFKRIREEDKYLVVANPSFFRSELTENLSITSAYSILATCGTILEDYPDLCLSIIGVAREIELHQWYDMGTSVVTKHKAEPVDEAVVAAARQMYDDVTPEHISRGLNLMLCSKLNFLHTDHHIGKPKLQGHFLKYFITEYYGEEATLSGDVHTALKSFFHWGCIKGLLYKLEVPNLNLSTEKIQAFASFPDPLPELKDNVYERYPAGTSKLSLIKKAALIIYEFDFSKVIPLPPTTDGHVFATDLDWLFELCNDVEMDPLKYHLRSTSKGLYKGTPTNLNDLNRTHGKRFANLLLQISIVLNVFDIGVHLLFNSKFPKIFDVETETTAEPTDQVEDDEDEIVIKRMRPEFAANEYLQKLIEIKSKIDHYYDMGWQDDDIMLRIGSVPNNLFDNIDNILIKYESEEEY